MSAHALVLHGVANRDKVNQIRFADRFAKIFVGKICEALHAFHAVCWAVQLNLLLKFRSSDWPDEED